MAKMFEKGSSSYEPKPLFSPITRMAAYPMDDTDIWVETDDEAKPVLNKLINEYVKGGQAFVGQRLTYITATGDVRHYTIIDTAGNLRMDAIFSYDEETLTLDIYASDISVE